MWRRGNRWGNPSLFGPTNIPAWSEPTALGWDALARMLLLVNSRSNKSQAQKSHLKGWLIMLKVFLLLPICGTCVLD
jgi:hypothetical protein